MGSFTVGCGISNLAINEGDEVGFSILSPSIKFRYGKENYGQSYYIYPTDLFEPFLPPVYGKYDDYGNITEVQESLTTKLLENMFHKPAEVVLNCISSQRSAYSSLSEIFKNYFIAEPTWNDWDRLSADILLAHGFTKDTGSPVTGRYLFGDYALEIAENADGSANSGGMWYVFYALKDEVLAHGSMGKNLDDIMDIFSQVTGQYPGFDVNDYDAIKTLNSLSGMFFLKEVYEGMKGYVMEDFLVKRQQTRLEDLWDKMMDLIEESGVGEEAFASDQSFAIVSSMDRIFRETSFPLNQFAELKVYGHNYEMLEMHTLNAMMGTVNKMLMPTVAGVADGENEAPHLLNSVSEAIVARRLDESNWD